MVMPIGLNYAFPLCGKCNERHSVFSECPTNRGNDMGELMRRYVEFDPAKRESLRKAYKQAIGNNADKFTFEGNEYLTRYAGYLLEYLDMKQQPRR